MLLPSYRHASGHYIVVPRAGRASPQPVAMEIEYLGEMALDRFAGDVQAKIVKGGLAGSAFVRLSVREFLRKPQAKLHGSKPRKSTSLGSVPGA